MDFKDCIEFAGGCRTVYLATSENNIPHVRPLALQFTDERGFYFQTEPVKSLYRQLKANNKAELCFHALEEKGLGRVMRVNGETEFVEDRALKERLFQERPFYKAIGIKGADDPLFALFRVYRGTAFFWTMADNMKESKIETIRFDCR